MNTEERSDEGDGDYEEEEILVQVNFEGGNLHEAVLERPEINFKLIGAMTSKPILQLDEQVFMGRYEDAVGTNVIFEENKSSPYFDPVFSEDPEIPLEYFTHTRKLLVMSRVFLKPKEENKTGEEEPKAGTSTMDLEIDKVILTSMEENKRKADEPKAGTSTMDVENDDAIHKSMEVNKMKAEESKAGTSTMDVENDEIRFEDDEWETDEEQ